MFPLAMIAELPVTWVTFKSPSQMIRLQLT